MTEFISSIGPAVANHLWQSTVFAVTVWLVTLLLRRNPARVRFSLWLTASVKFLVPFSLLIGLGGMLPRPQRVVTAAPAAVYSAMDAVVVPFSGLNVPAASLSEHVPSLRERATAALPMVLAAVWLCGMMVVLLVWCVRWWRVSATRRRAVAVERAREVEILQQMGGRIPLRLTRELMEPGIFGVFRPVLLWPERLSEKLEDEHIEAIMAHELEHVRRRDNLTAMLHMVAEALFWCHPMVWWIERRMVEEREQACDEAVVQMGGSAEAYAESLLKACRFCVESPLVCVSGITGADLKMRIQSIMRSRLERLGFGRKALLAVAGILVMAGPVLFGVMHVPLVRAQTEDADAKGAAFDVVSIKPHPAGGIISMIGMEVTPDEVHGVYMTVPMMIGAAYGIQSDDMVSGAPGWAKNERFDFTGKMSEADIATMKTLNKTEQKARRNQMLRAMLAERFHLKVHRATKQVPVYELVVAKGGAKLKDAATDMNSHPVNGPDGKPFVGLLQFMGDRTIAQGYSMKGLADQLTQPMYGLVRPVIDKTGMTGSYNFVLNWSPPLGAMLPGAVHNTASPEDGSSIFTALGDIGLRLQPSTGPVETVVIDHVERPAGDAGGEVPQAKDVPAQVRAQDQAVDMAVRPPEFEVATIKPSKDMSGDSGTTLFGNEYEANNKTLEDIIRSAYGITSGGKDRLSGGPGWINSTRFDIKAKLAESDVAELQKLPREQQLKRSQLMLQALLADRFRLKVHHETKELPVYVLTVAKSSPKLTPSSPSESQNQHGVRAGRGQIIGMDAKLDTFVNVLGMQPEIGRLIFDKTGLTGSYDFTLRWTPEGMAGRDSTPPPDSSWPSLFTALQEQLGLKLELTKGPVDTIVIDSVEMPSAN